MHAYIIFVTLLPALSLHPFELSSLCSGNPISVNHQVINDHFFPAEYGWLRLTLQLDLALTDRRTAETAERQTAIVVNWHCKLPAFSSKHRAYLSHKSVRQQRFCCVGMSSQDSGCLDFRIQRRDKQSYIGYLKHIAVGPMTCGNLYSILNIVNVYILKAINRVIYYGQFYRSRFRQWKPFSCFSSHMLLISNIFHCGFRATCYFLGALSSGICMYPINIIRFN